MDLNSSDPHLSRVNCVFNHSGDFALTLLDSKVSCLPDLFLVALPSGYHVLPASPFSSRHLQQVCIFRRCPTFVPFPAHGLTELHSLYCG